MASVRLCALILVAYRSFAAVMPVSVAAAVRSAADAFACAARAEDDENGQRVAGQIVTGSAGTICDGRRRQAAPERAAPGRTNVDEQRRTNRDRHRRDKL